MFAIFKLINKLKARKMKFIGEDLYKNKYYESKTGKRICIYYKSTEVSKIPPHWFAFMHYFPNISNFDEKKQHAWERYHTPNGTGGDFAYFPKNSLKKVIETGNREKNLGYEAWKV